VELFEAHDVNRSGYLDYRELRNALSSAGVELTAPETIEVLRRYDERPDLRLDLLEFDRLVSDAGLITKLGVPVKVSLIFGMHDVNKSGYLDYRELRNALRSLGVVVSSPAAASLLLSYDERPGKLDILEFRRLHFEFERFVAAAHTSVAARPATTDAQAWLGSAHGRATLQSLSSAPGPSRSPKPALLPGFQPASARRRVGPPPLR